jgi:hypothetical protein
MPKLFPVRTVRCGRASLRFDTKGIRISPLEETKGAIHGWRRLRQLPLVILLLGMGFIALFMMARP